MGDPSRVRVTGPLEPYASSFAGELTRHGYTKGSAASQLQLLAHLSRWLATEGLQVAELTTAVSDAFLATRRAAGYRMLLSPRALVPLLKHLRGLSVAPPEPHMAPSRTEAMLARYREYLSSERGLTAATSRGYADMVRPFLRTRERLDGTLDLDKLAEPDITAFVLAAVPGRRCGPAKLTVTALRSLLAFLHVEGVITQSLASAVPSVAGSRLAGLPKALGLGQVQQLLASCDQSTAIGRRDFAILTMLVRLGVRAGEITALELGDVDWRGGEIIVRGKGDRHECLPLPVDVGRAVAAYLRRGRPTAVCRRLFLRAVAPHRALTTSAVSTIVSNAAHNAGLPPMGAHRLRHTAATEMLRAGAPLSCR